jgi:hypothetical protein
MAPGTYANPEGKICPQCGWRATLDAQSCVRCGHAYRQHFPPAAPPPQYAQGPNPTQAFYGQFPPPQAITAQRLAEFSMQFNESRRVVRLTFWIGLFCLWPVWIITYIEYTKMRNIKEELARAGIDVRWWQTTYNAPDAF